MPGQNFEQPTAAYFQLVSNSCSPATLQSTVQSLATDNVIKSSSSLSCDKSIASSKLSSPKSAILSFLLQLPVSSCFLKLIHTAAYYCADISWPVSSLSAHESESTLRTAERTFVCWLLVSNWHVGTAHSIY
jgi:hypothetical protein